MVVSTVISTAYKTAARPGQRWAYGPLCFAGEHKAYTTALQPYLDWVAEVERSLRNLDAAAQRIRLLYYGRAAGSKLFDDVLGTDDRWAVAPLTTADVAQATLDGLMRTGQLDVGVDSAGRPRPLVDITHVWVLIDAALNGLSIKGYLFDLATEPEGALSWSGDLGSWWDEYNTPRLVDRAAAAAGRPWTEPTDAAGLVKPLGWLRSGTATRCAADDLLGDMDAMILRQEAKTLHPADPTPLTALLAGYYGPPPISPTDRNLLHSMNRFHLFVRRAVPSIPHTYDAPTGVVTLAANAKDRIRAVVEDAAFWLIFKARLGNPADLAKYAAVGTVQTAAAGAFAYAVRRSVWDDLRSPWGAAMLDQIAGDFIAFLQAGLAGDGWTLNNWPVLPSPLQPYGGYALRLGDNDAQGRHGGATHTYAAPVTYVRDLQQHLVDLGFTGVGPPDGGFGPATAMAVRELQIEASYDQIIARGPGPTVQEFKREAIRRFQGVVNGVADAETAATILHWRDPSGSLAGHPIRAGAGLTRIVNPLTIQSWQVNGRVPVSVVDADVWRYDEETNTSLRLYALDRLERYAIPAAEQLTQGTGMAAIGSYTEFYSETGALLGKGPVLQGGSRWEATKLNLATMLPPLIDPNNAAVRSQYRVIRAVAQVECQGYYDVINAYDAGRLSIGMYHWALMRLGVGELAALLAYYQQFDRASYHADFGRFGIEPERPWDPSQWGDDGAAAQSKFAGRIAMYGLRDAAGTVYPQTLRPLGDRVSGTQTLVDAYLPDDYLRSWRSIHRVVMALRTSPALQRVQWPFALERVRALLARPWTNSSSTQIPVVTAGGVTRVATFGEIFTSERAVACLLRWHVNRPGYVLAAAGVVVNAADLTREPIHQAYLNVYGTGRVDLSAIAEPTASQRQEQLVAQLIALAPTDQGFRTSVTNASNYVDAEAGALLTTAGSFQRP